MHIDPFHIKRFPKYHHKRLIYTSISRLQDLWSKYYFAEYELPIKLIDNLPEKPSLEWADTQVESEHARYLLYALHSTENLGGCVVEVGAWRGVTTALLAQNTKRDVIAIDPWIGAPDNFDIFRGRTALYSNVLFLKNTCGQAYREWKYGEVSFAFIDAQHDYDNTTYDLMAVTSLMKPGGIIAFHDTDNISFAGCRRAVYEQAHHYRLIGHIQNLTLLQVREIV
jgi:predicted O-methyltransferase YrrM